MKQKQWKFWLGFGFGKDSSYVGNEMSGFYIIDEITFGFIRFGTCTFTKTLPENLNAKYQKAKSKYLSNGNL